MSWPGCDPDELDADYSPELDVLDEAAEESSRGGQTPTAAAVLVHGMGDIDRGLLECMKVMPADLVLT